MATHFKELFWYLEVNKQQAFLLNPASESPPFWHSCLLQKLFWKPCHYFSVFGHVQALAEDHTVKKRYQIISFLGNKPGSCLDSDNTLSLLEEKRFLQFRNI